MNKRPKQSRDAEKTKEQLVAAAKKEFAKHGLRGANVRDIAKDAKANVSLISYYFGGKEGLYRAVLEGFAKTRIAMLDRIVTPPQTKEEFRLRTELVIEELLNFHLAEPEMIQIIMRDLHLDSKMDKSVEKIFTQFFFKLIGYAQEAKEKGFIREDIEPMMFTGLLYFAFQALIQIDPFAHKATGITVRDPEYRKEVIRQVMRITFDGVMKP